MSFGNIGKRVFDTALKWGRRPPPPPPHPHAAASPAPPAPMANIGHASDALTVVMREAEVRRIDVARGNRAARTAESTAALQTFLASVRHLPLFSGTAMQLVRSAGDETVGALELSRLIATDAALVAHLLRIVNSPYFGFARRLATVGDALAVLGVDHVRRTVTASVLQRPLMSYLHDSQAARAFWRHELLCGALARHLAARAGNDGEIAFMAGLMHDVGRLAMLMQFPARADALLHVPGDDDRYDLDREFHEFGFDHAQAGGALLELWGLPPEIVRATRDHVDEFEPDEAISACVWRANALTHAMTVVDDEFDEVQHPWMIEIGLSVPARRRMIDEIRAFESD